MNSVDRIQRTFTRFALFCIALMVVFVAGVITAATLSEPNCPTEDSCSASYDNGQWTITEDTN